MLPAVYHNFDVIAIDEGQFFPDLKDFCDRAANEGKIVMVAALDGTFEQQPFGAVCDLVPLAEKFDKLSAVCAISGRDAAFTRRISAETAVEVIGGAEMYMPVSRGCTQCAVDDPNPPVSGELQLVFGPMFSGKSTELMRRIRRYSFAQKKCVVCKYAKDQRYAGEHELASHDGNKMMATGCLRLEEVKHLIDEYDVIGVDEGQFFPDLAAFCEEAADRGKIVVVAALDGTFERQPFGQVCSLIPKAEKVEKLSAVCKISGQDAAFSRRIGGATDVEVIGGAELYLPVCRAHLYSVLDLPRVMPSSPPRAKASPKKKTTPPRSSPISSPPRRVTAPPKLTTPQTKKSPPRGLSPTSVTADSLLGPESGLFRQQTIGHSVGRDL
jgi:thymidine kinase